MTCRSALVAGLVVLLAPAGCAAPTPSRPTASCDGGQLTVTFDGDAVRVTNHGAA